MISEPKPSSHFIRVRTAERTWEISVESDDFFIGRDETVQVRIELLEVSRKHVRVSISEGRAYVQDLGSANGTFLGRNRLAPGERVAMPDIPGHPEELILGDVAWIMICPAVPELKVTDTIPDLETPAPTTPSLITETLAKIEQVQAEAVRFSEAIREEAKKDVASLQKSAREECEQELQKARLEVTALQAKREELERETQELDIRAVNLRKNCAELESTLGKSESMLASLEKRREEVELQSIESSGGLRAMETERQSLTEEVERLRKKVETLIAETAAQDELCRTQREELSCEARKQKALSEALDAELRAKKVGVEAAIGEIELQRIEAKTLLQKILSERSDVELEISNKKKEFDRGLQLEQERLETIHRQIREAEQALEQTRSDSEKSISQLDLARANAAEEKQALERDLKEIEQLRARHEKAMETEFVQRGKEMERELADAKLQELEKIKGLENEMREAERARRRFILDEIVGAATRLTGAPPPDDTEFRKTVLAVLEGKTIAAVHAGASKRSRKFWRKTALWTATPIALGLFLWLAPLPRMVSNGLNRTIASENKSDSVFLKEIQDQGMKYQPAQDEHYRDTYADNVLYLKGYVAMKRDEAEKKRWTLLLNDFIVGKLGLSDRVIPDFISKESVMIQELADEGGEILPQFKDQGIARLADTEKRELPGLVALMESQENYAKFRAFEKSYYEDYIARAAKP